MKLEHIGGLVEVRKYREWIEREYDRQDRNDTYGRGIATGLDRAQTKADAAIAELEAERDNANDLLDVTLRKLQDTEAERDALKCCGNCASFTNVEYEMCDRPDLPTPDPECVSAPDHCHIDWFGGFSRWERRQP